VSDDNDSLEEFFSQVKIARADLMRLAPDYPDYQSFKAAARLKYSADIIEELNGLRILYEAAGGGHASA